jgi:hypothetical protein
VPPLHVQVKWPVWAALLTRRVTYTGAAGLRTHVVHVDGQTADQCCCVECTHERWCLLLQQHAIRADELMSKAVSAAVRNLLGMLNACWVVINPGEELTGRDMAPGRKLEPDVSGQHLHNSWLTGCTCNICTEAHAAGG